MDAEGFLLSASFIQQQLECSYYDRPMILTSGPVWKLLLYMIGVISLVIVSRITLEPE